MSDIQFRIKNNRIQILAWAPSGYDHDEGMFEIANIKLSNSRNSYMHDWNLDELLSLLKEVAEERH